MSSRRAQLQRRFLRDCMLGSKLGCAAASLDHHTAAWNMPSDCMMIHKKCGLKRLLHFLQPSFRQCRRTTAFPHISGTMNHANLSRTAEKRKNRKREDCSDVVLTPKNSFDRCDRGTKKNLHCLGVYVQLGGLLLQKISSMPQAPEVLCKTPQRAETKMKPLRKGKAET
jgi:hypothetical protein